MSHLKKLPHPKHYAKRLFKNGLAGLIIVTFSLVIGMLGYHRYFKLNWVDSLYNASMILTGMGPVDKAINDEGKIFASFYAIYSGVTFLTGVAVILSPVVHRFLHRFKIEVEE
jgi:Kef-type K+ transport system membrane component KefB